MNIKRGGSKCKFISNSYPTVHCIPTSSYEFKKMWIYRCCLQLASHMHNVIASYYSVEVFNFEFNSHYMETLNTSSFHEIKETK